ncbi:MAG TPA: hypothetical protein VH000_10790 [Rhizomicrobium sp.]|nr:hypothetical protein [Rhizomicrobium sp.]
MSDRQDDIENLLMEQFDGPVPDGGFCERVMQVVPARRRRYAWPLALGIAAGAVLCWLSLLSAPLVRTGWHDWLSGELSAPALTLLVTMAGISLLALAWTAAEADDR